MGTRTTTSDAGPSSPTGPGRRAGVLLDRDGTINVDHGYVGSVDRVDLLPGAAEAIARLNAGGVPVAVVTNQAGVARGLYGIDDVEEVNAHIAAELARVGAQVDLWLFCPYHPDGTVAAFARMSADRKPGPGMALAAAEALSLDLEQSWVIGDALSDVGLARAVGAEPLLVGATPAADGTRTFPDLAGAVEHVLGQLDQERPTERPRFPMARYRSAASYVDGYRAEVGRTLSGIDPSSVEGAAEVLLAAYERGAVVFSCGNGGSASIANHLQCDHVKTARQGTSLRNRVFSLSANVELLSAIANDLSYDDVFEYQLQSQAREGDVLFAISSSGASTNIVRALDWANDNGLHTIALTGFEGEPARSHAKVSIHVPSTNYGVIEDAHQACMHMLAQYVRHTHLPPDEAVSAVY